MTKGHWRVRTVPRRFWPPSARRRREVVNTYGAPVAVANDPQDAELIAAAPEMLELLKQTVAILTSDELNSMFVMLHVHGGKYTGPKVDTKRMSDLIKQIGEA